MRAGRLRHRVEVFQPVETENTNGEDVVSWQSLLHCWAEIGPLKGGERMLGREVSHEVSHQIDMRYGARTRRITPSMRIHYKGREFQIEGVINVGERNEMLRFYCIEQAAK